MEKAGSQEACSRVCGGCVIRTFPTRMGSQATALDVLFLVFFFVTRAVFKVLKSGLV